LPNSVAKKCPIPERHSRRSRTCTVSRIGRSGNARDMAGVLLSIAESLFPHSSVRPANIHGGLSRHDRSAAFQGGMLQLVRKRSRKTAFWTFPLGVRGSEVTNSTAFGTL
jgi:hypothetical protein